MADNKKTETQTKTEIQTKTNKEEAEDMTWLKTRQVDVNKGSVREWREWCERKTHF
jgi:hypothetical protein